MIIDGHVHLFENDLLASKIMAAFNRKFTIESLNSGRGTADDLSAKMVMTGISKSIISNFSTPKHVDSINRWSLDVAAKREKYVSLVSFHPMMSGLSKSLVYEYLGLGAKGIKLHPMAQEFDPQNEILFPFYELAGKLDLPIVFHCGRVANARTNGFADTERILPIIERFNTTNFILTHMADGNVKDVIDISFRFPNVWFDTSIVVTGYDELIRFNTPSWTDDTLCVEVFRKVGAERFLFGSDYPWGDPVSDLMRFHKMDLSEEEKTLILGKNAVKLFKL
jgi:hypothetical protein